MTLIVCSLAALPDVIAARRPSHVITLLDPDLMIAPAAGVAGDNHLRLAVDDIAEPAEGMVTPDEAMVARLLAFSRGWDGEAPMIVHCLAGVSRSTAGALAVACDRNPHASEHDIAQAMRRLAPHAYPNRRIVALADHLLDRRGRLIDAVEAIGRDDLGFRPRPFDLPSRFAAPAQTA
jgi:predicted protein tyrosine phosphatase